MFDDDEDKILTGADALIDSGDEDQPKTGKQLYIENLEQQIEEFLDPDTDPRAPLEDQIGEIEEMNEDELMDKFRDNDNCGFAVMDQVVQEMKMAGVPQEKIDEVRDMNPEEVMEKYGEDRAETVRNAAISELADRIEELDKHLEGLNKDLGEAEENPDDWYE